MTRAYSYVRFSTKSQVTGDSLDRQLKKAREYASEHDLVLDTSTYQDLGVSAFKGKNAATGELSAFTEAVDSGRVQAGSFLLVESLDRISRAEVDVALELFMSIIRRGITIVTLMDRQVYSSARIKEDRGISLIISILAMVRAHEESATKSVRVRSGLAAKRAAGVKREKCPHWLRLSADRQSYEVIETEANIIRRMFEMSAKGIGAHTISMTLNAETDRRWFGPNVLRTLKSPAVIGTLVSRKGHEPLMDHYTPIISKELFYEVQSHLTRRGIQKGGAAPDDIPNLFSGLLRCGGCGGSLRYNRSSTGRFAYLKCLNSLYKSGDCDAGAVQYEGVEKELLAFLLFDQDDELIPLNKPVRANSVASHQAEIQSLKDQKNRLIELAQAGLTNISDTVQRLNDVEAKIKAVEAQIVIPPPIDEAREAVERAMSLFVEHEERSLDSEPTRYYEVRREIRTAFQKAIKRIDVLDDQVKIKFVWSDTQVPVRRTDTQGTPTHKEP